ncbi:ABC transporter permease [Miniphocaeibacter halophilus]|uniref:ABC transporter permease n=1 Tax=Miniphocaeibacter halophilus TaxID=2931922 RepID=A0AC61MVD2_9FIRM|nr:ABC transporter permease [Miniphocaeibacter halophilus]QQK08370.1 ABC transporter permease [Miniphocaeibacter halophilus]
MLEFLKLNYMDILNKTLEHLYISSMSLFLGVIVAVPLGIILTKTKKLSNLVIGLASLLQTIPSLALLAIMIPIFGVGKFPAIIALFIYSLLPILRNTYLGVVGVDENIVDAAKGMGMTKTQSILKVEIPLAAPVIMAGIRLSAVYVVAWATLASYIGAGGLGDLIFSGLNNYNPNLIIFGTIPVTALALIVDFLLSKVEKIVTAKTGMEEV